MPAAGGRYLSSRDDSQGLVGLKTASDAMLVGLSLTPRRPASAVRPQPQPQQPAPHQLGQPCPPATCNTSPSPRAFGSFAQSPPVDMAMPEGAPGGREGAIPSSTSQSAPMTNLFHMHQGDLPHLSTFSSQQMKRLFKAMSPCSQSLIGCAEPPAEVMASFAGDAVSDSQGVSIRRSSLHPPTFGILQNTYQTSMQRQSDSSSGEG